MNYDGRKWQCQKMILNNNSERFMVQSVEIVQPRGTLNATQSQELKQKITEIIEKSNARIVLVDFEEVTFMDSSGLGALVLAFKALQAANRKLVLCGLNEQIRILFELTGTDKVFEIFPNQEEFKKAVSFPT
jgi:anti-anti-sigma factor